jgi:hypothetical protein
MAITLSSYSWASHATIAEQLICSNGLEGCQAAQRDMQHDGRIVLAISDYASDVALCVQASGGIARHWQLA